MRQSALAAQEIAFEVVVVAEVNPGLVVKFNDLAEQVGGLWIHAGFSIADACDKHLGARAVEQERHRRFAHLREGGEWFRADDELLEHVRTISAGASPWDAYARWLSEELRR